MPIQIPVVGQDPGILRIGGYMLIPPLSGEQSEPISFLLDTNVLVDVRDFFFGAPRMKLGSRERQELKALLEFLATTRSGITPQVNWGFCAQEASSPKRSLACDRLQYRKVLHAADRVFNWRKDQVRKAFENRHAPCNRDRGAMDFAEMKSPDVILRVFGSGYAALLKAAMMHNARKSSRKDQDASLRLYEEFLDWMIDDLGMVGAYEHRVAGALLAGDSASYEGARRLLGLSGSDSPERIAHCAWNAAWDLWLLRATDGFSAGIMPFDYPVLDTWVVSKNHDLEWLRRGGQVAAVLENGPDSGPDVFTIQHISARSPELTDRMMEIERSRHKRIHSSERRSRTPEQIHEQGMRSLLVLERAIGVEPIQSTANPPD